MTIDITRLPAPNVIQPIDYETELQAMKDDLIAKDASLADVLALESEPLTMLLEVCAYRVCVKAQEFNDRAKALLLAYASGADLDHLGVTYYRTERLLIDAGDPNAVPPVPATYESDSDYLARILLAEDGYSTAGPEPAYIYHASSASGQVKDVSITSPAPMQIVVTVLSHVGDGTPDASLLDAVDAALADGVRPLSDQVTVQAPVILPFTVDATLTLYPGLNQETVRAAAEASLTAWLDTQHRIGRDITVSGIHAALRVSGVHDITLNAPGITATLVVSDTEAAWCSGVTVSVGGTGG